MTASGIPARKILPRKDGSSLQSARAMQLSASPFFCEGKRSRSSAICWIPCTISNGARISHVGHATNVGIFRH